MELGLWSGGLPFAPSDLIWILGTGHSNYNIKVLSIDYDIIVKNNNFSFRQIIIISSNIIAQGKMCTILGLLSNLHVNKSAKMDIKGYIYFLNIQ